MPDEIWLSEKSCIEKMHLIMLEILGCSGTGDADTTNRAREIRLQST